MTWEPDYATNDVDELNMTQVLHRLFKAISESGATSDPLQLVCQSLVGGVPDIRFAFYVYDGDETRPIAARKDDLKI